MDTIGDMLTTIINAQRVQKARVAVPYSRFKQSLARTFKEKGWLADERVQEGPRSKLVLTLSYSEGGRPRIQGLKRLSTPGRRLYVHGSRIPYSRDGVGTIIISTPKGLLDDRQARKQGVGGELVCEVW